MSVESVLAAGREAALATMLDTCLIARTGEAVFDPGTGSYVPQEDAQVYPVGSEPGRCRVKPLTATDVQAGEREVALRSYRVELPWDIPARVLPEDVVMVTESSDTWLIGHPLVVTAVELATARTARWLTVEDRNG